MDKAQNSKYDILVVDDEPLIRESLYEILRIDGYHAHSTEIRVPCASIQATE